MKYIFVFLGMHLIGCGPSAEEKAAVEQEKQHRIAAQAHKRNVVVKVNFQSGIKDTFNIPVFGNLFLGGPEYTILMDDFYNAPIFSGVNSCIIIKESDDAAQ